MEIEFIELFSKMYGVEVTKNYTIYYETEDGRRKCLFPDGVILNEYIILEFNGTLWHADKRKYAKGDIVHDGITAEEIWKRDAFKKQVYESQGFKLFVMWELDFQKNKIGSVRKLVDEVLKSIKRI